MRVRFRSISGFLLLAWARLEAAEARLVVVVNSESGVTQVTQEEARNIVLGRQKRLASGVPAVPVEQDSPAGIRSRFYRLLVNKDLTEINAYWARLCFTGQAHPPRAVMGSESVVRSVAADRGGIGLMLMDLGKLDARVRVALDLGAQDGP